jgi:sterol desaturase/sphingolipid hydroxylase (fatty acid hydroxylase superfamily)
MLENIVSYLLFPFLFLIQATSQYYWLTYVTAAFTALVCYALVRRRGYTLRAAKALLLPRRLLRHPSTWLDFKLFLLGSYYLLVQALLTGGFTIFTVDYAGRFLTQTFGPAPAPVGPSYVITGLSIVIVFLAVEFGYWLAHYAMHRIPALWEFHKVHHSAEVLTPITEWRQHPVELAIFPILIGLVSTFIQGPIVWYFGASSQIINPVSANLISMAFWYTTVHIRHSQLPLYVSGIWARLIQTPPHHQVHHSTDPRHFDKNLGYCLSLWDWVFGTLYVPVKGEKLSFGLGHKDSALETAVGSILAPFGRAAMVIIRQTAKWRTAKPAPLATKTSAEV